MPFFYVAKTLHILLVCKEIISVDKLSLSQYRPQ